MQNVTPPTIQPRSILWQGGIDWNEFLTSRGQPAGVELVGANASQELRLLELVATWSISRTDDGAPAYPNLRIVTSDANADSPQVISDAALTFKRLFGRPIPNEIRELMTNGLRMIHVPKGDSSTLPTILEGTATDSLVYLLLSVEGISVDQSPSASTPATPLASLLSEICTVVGSSTGVVIVDMGDRTLSLADSQQLNSLYNLGYSVSSRVSLKTATLDQLEELWLYAWINQQNERAIAISTALSNRFGRPTPDRMIVFHAMRELCVSMAATESSLQAAFLLPTPELALELHRILRGDSVDFEQLELTLGSVPPDWRSLICLCVAEGASHRDWHSDVLSIVAARGLSPELGEVAIELLLTSIEKVLLSRREDESLEDLVVAVSEVLSYIAINHKCIQARLRLSSLLSPDRSDMVGIALLAYILQRSASAIGDIEASSDVGVATAATDEELMTFIEKSVVPNPDGSIVMGGLSIPCEILIPSADALMERLLQMISYSQKHDSDDIDTNTHEMLSTVGVSLAKHTSRPDLDLGILRFLGSRLSLSGKLQRSRDVAESLLIESAGNSRRARLGWGGYADIYNRGKNQIQAAIGMCCALSIDVPRTADEAILELSTVARILRDSGLLAIAESVSKRLSQLVRSSNRGSLESNRADFLNLSIRMQRILGEKNVASDEVVALIEDTTRHLERATEIADATLPATILLGQLINFASKNGVLITGETHESVRAARSLLDGRQALLFDIACGRPDSTQALLAYVRQLEHARFDSDIGYDLQIAALAARRILASPQARTDKEMVVFASELANDLGVSLPPFVSASTKRLPSELDGPASTVRSISRSGVDIVTLASNSSGEVVVTKSHQGQIVVSKVLGSEAFSLEYLKGWSKEFPYKFASIPGEDGASAGVASAGGSRLPVDEDARFIAAMEPLRLGIELDRPTIFVADPLLQSIPPNLFLINDTFSGRRIAVGCAPSLTWLDSAVASYQAEFGPPAAWISDSGDSAAWRATLNVLAERVSDHLKAYSIPLSRSTSPSRSLRGAEVAIIGAHGGLANTQRFFRVLADDAQKRIAPEELIGALHGARIVVLFVCSGGRVDQHPFAQSTVGLPRQLLAGGVEAVVASPWPLDVRVPDYWLPSFLEAWCAGETLMEANFRANAKVAVCTGSPEFALAMTVYGNPLARRSMNVGGQLADPA